MISPVRLSRVAGCPYRTCIAILVLIAGNLHTLSMAAVAGQDRGLPPATQRLVSFEEEIQPLLARRCFDCHGSERQRSGLRLDLAEAMMKGGDSGPAVVPGRGGESLLIRLVAGLEEDRIMPPKGDRLTADEIGLLRAWIDQGARGSIRPGAADQVAQDHWAFRPVTRPSMPGSFKTTDGRLHRIDEFIAATLAPYNLSLAPEADRTTLIRRLFVVMLGVPPTPEEVARFLDDPDPRAFERLVDGVLADPRYGERWARHWLDVVRFAESNGFETNRERPNAWRYRDYVIQAFNLDLPYDRFVREQIAGDALGADVATGFLVGGPVDIVASPDPVLTAQQRADELDDMVNTTGTAFLGLTVGCARCHAHKFDPIDHREYFALTAVFAGVRHGDRPLPLPAEDEARLATIDRVRADLEGRLKPFLIPAGDGTSASKLPADGLRPHVDARQNAELIDPPVACLTYRFDAVTPSEAEQGRQWLDEFEKLGTEREQLLGLRPLAYAGTFQQPGPTHRQHRGDPMQPREEVPPGSPALFRPFTLPADAGEQQRRLALADWIVHPDNPLTARVLVNRLWQYHFGVGLVDTPNDFGRNGSKPTHPELLDWLANELVHRDWSIKNLQRQILLSATWRQSSAPQSAALEVDAASRLLWRFPPRRLEAEAIRDSILNASGALESTGGGPGFHLLEVERENVYHYHPKESFGPGDFRRMVYAFKIRMEQDGIFGAFDCPDGSLVTPRRSISTTPLQALNLFNSRFVLDQAGQFAQRLRVEAGPDLNAQINRAWQLAFLRSPTPAEAAEALAFAREQGVPALGRALFNSNEFLFIP